MTQMMLLLISNCMDIQFSFHSFVSNGNHFVWFIWFLFRLVTLMFVPGFYISEFRT